MILALSIVLIVASLLLIVLVLLHRGKGGGLSNIEVLYDALPPLLAASVFADAIATPVVKNRHGDASGVRGAAWLWPDAAD